jgi:hypothetical protein
MFGFIPKKSDLRTSKSNTYIVGYFATVPISSNVMTG